MKKKWRKIPNDPISSDFGETILGEHEFKKQYLGQFWPTKEVTDDTNRPSKDLFEIFSKVCYKIEQPCSRCRAEAKPGDWYLSLHHDMNWYIMEMGNEGAQRPFNIGGLKAKDLRETLMYVDCFIFQYNSNQNSEEDS